MIDHIETMIVGGGQAGLATSYCLKQRGHEHVIFEKANKAADAWRKRWDSFTLVTPNWMIQLPGAEYLGDDPHGFMGRDKIVAYIEAYVKRFDLPIQYGITVTSVEPADAGYLVKTDKGNYHAKNVVIAVGFYQHPKVPTCHRNCAPGVYQIHSSKYQNPEMLPEGAVLVVGSAQSGSQIAEELREEGRSVYLSVSATGRIPRRYRGKDATEWMKRLGFFERTVDQLPPDQSRYASSAHGSGKNGGHNINLHQFAKDGIQLMGHVVNIEQDQVHLAPDLKQSLAKADQYERDLIREIDQYIEEKGLDIPEETVPRLKDGYEVEEIRQLSLKAAGIRNIIWATGFKCDYRWVKIPVFDKDGIPVHTRGAAAWHGLYFIGMPFLYSGKSGLLYGAAEDAAHITASITSNEKVLRYTR